MINKILKLGKKIGIIKDLEEEIEELMQDHLRGFGSEAYIPHWVHESGYSEGGEERILDYKNKRLLVAYYPTEEGYIRKRFVEVRKVPVPYWIVPGFVPEGKYKYKKNKENRYVTEIQPIPQKYWNEIKKMIIRKYGFSEGYRVEEGWPFSITLVDLSAEDLEERIHILIPSSIELAYYHITRNETRNFFPERI